MANSYSRINVLKFAASYLHSKILGNPHETSKNEINGIKETDTPIFDGLTVGKLYEIKGLTGGFRDMHGQINIKGSGNSDPSWAVFLGGIRAFSFSASQLNEVVIEFHPDHDYDETSGYYPHVHISTNSGSPSGTVRFGFEYTSAKGYDQGSNSNFPTTTTIYLEYTFTVNSQYRHIILETASPIIDLNTEIDRIILCRVFRDAQHPNDTFTGAIYLFRCDLHYKTKRITTPNKNFPFG